MPVDANENAAFTLLPGLVGARFGDGIGLDRDGNGLLGVLPVAAGSSTRATRPARRRPGTRANTELTVAEPLAIHPKGGEEPVWERKWGLAGRALGAR